jgi:hypothetical protein
LSDGIGNERSSIGDVSCCSKRSKKEKIGNSLHESWIDITNKNIPRI